MAPTDLFRHIDCAAYLWQSIAGAPSVPAEDRSECPCPPPPSFVRPGRQRRPSTAPSASLQCVAHCHRFIFGHRSHCSEPTTLSAKPQQAGISPVAFTRRCSIMALCAMHPIAPPITAVANRLRCEAGGSSRADPGVVRHRHRRLPWDLVLTAYHAANQRLRPPTLDFAIGWGAPTDRHKSGMSVPLSPASVAARWPEVDLAALLSASPAASLRGTWGWHATLIRSRRWLPLRLRRRAWDRHSRF